MLLRKYEMPWRKVYEAYAAVAWLLCLMGLFYVWWETAVPEKPIIYLAWMATGFFLFNIVRAWKIWRMKWALGGKGISFITDTQLKSKVEKTEGALWVGKGFDWSPLHTQRVYEIKRANPSTVYPPVWIMKLRETLSAEPVGANTPAYNGEKNGYAHVHYLFRHAIREKPSDIHI